MEGQKIYKDLTIDFMLIDLYGGVKFSYTIKSDEQFITASSASGLFFSTHAEAVEHANNFIDENFE